MLLKCCTLYASRFGKLSSGHRTGKGQFSFQSQRKTMPKNVQTVVSYAYFTCQQGNAQNPSSQGSTVHELRTYRCISWIQKRQRNQRSNCQHPLNHRTREFQKNIYLFFVDYAKAFECVDHNTLWKIIKEMGVPDHLTCLQRNLYTDQ